MKIQKRSILQIGASALGAGLLIFGFQNCAQSRLQGPGLEDAGHDVKTQITEEEAVAQAKTYSSFLADSNSHSEDQFRRASENMLTGSGDLLPVDWETRAQQLKILKSNVSVENKPEALAVANLVLTQLVSEIGAEDSLSPAQMTAVGQSVALLTYGIRSQEEMAQLRDHFLAQTQNSQLAAQLARELGPAF